MAGLQNNSQGQFQYAQLYNHYSQFLYVNSLVSDLEIYNCGGRITKNIQSNYWLNLPKLWPLQRPDNHLFLLQDMTWYKLCISE